MLRAKPATAHPDNKEQPRRRDAECGPRHGLCENVHVLTNLDKCAAFGRQPHRVFMNAALRKRCLAAECLQIGVEFQIHDVFLSGRPRPGRE